MEYEPKLLLNKQDRKKLAFIIDDWVQAGCDPNSALKCAINKFGFLYKTASNYYRLRDVDLEMTIIEAVGIFVDPISEVVEKARERKKANKINQEQ